MAKAGKLNYLVNWNKSLTPNLLSMRYRKNVAAFIINNNGEILTCERCDYPGCWQLPQGGIDEGESVEDALWRELMEEIGTNSAQILDALIPPLRYDWPDEIRKIRGFAGQEQFFYLLRLNDEAEIDFCTHDTQEFRSYQWLNSTEFAVTISGFKKDNYLMAMKMLTERNPGVLA
ncbi:MAG: RNA pyrophosphohydrolase [bacterium]|nr:RNA pyrophosphohydrolase [bacterium]